MDRIDGNIGKQRFYRVGDIRLISRPLRKYTVIERAPIGELAFLVDEEEIGRDQGAYGIGILVARVTEDGLRQIRDVYILPDFLVRSVIVGINAEKYHVVIVGIKTYQGCQVLVYAP